MVRVPLEEFKGVTKKALKLSGYTPVETEVIVDVLLYAQLRGNNQGVVKLVGGGMPKSHLTKPVRQVKQTPISAVLDGGKNQGMVVMKEAVELAVLKAKANKVGIVGTHNTSSSTGAIGYWADSIARRGLIAFVFSTSSPTVAPEYSYERVFGTNPFAIGIPSVNDPIVLDMATSASTWFGLVEAKTSGKQVSPDVGYDSKGRKTTDPGAILDGGAIRPVAGHKGSGLALIVSLLAGPLVMASHVGKPDARTNWGNLIIAFDPALLTDLSHFTKEVEELHKYIKQAKKLEGVSELFVPGERGNRKLKEALESGFVELEDNLYKELKRVAVSGPSTLFPKL